MDPNYGVLMDYGGSENCGESEVKNKDGITAAVVGGVIGGIAGLIIVFLVAFFVVYPRVKTWMQTRRGRDMVDLEEIPESQPEQSEMQIEKIPDMSVNTAAGTFVVKF